MHICNQEEQHVTTAEAAREATYKCPHVGCDFKFHNKHGAKIHAGRCRHKDTYLLDKILDVKGDCGSPLRRFLVSWQGYDDQTWEPYENLPPNEIKEFLLANNLYNYDWEGARCDECDKPCKNIRGVKSHKRFCYCNKFNQQKYFNRTGQQQSHKGTKAESAAKTTKLIQAQRNMPVVKCEGSALNNAFRFKYLGSIFAADGEQQHNIKRRAALAAARCDTDSARKESPLPQN